MLACWAVPKGLPSAPGEKHLAVRTEDHPLAYAEFEGWIPKGNYGAGEIRIFDRGTYEAPEWREDKITLRLAGLRHQGEYHMVKTARAWLVFLAKGSSIQSPEAPLEFCPMLAEGVHQLFETLGGVSSPSSTACAPWPTSAPPPPGWCLRQGGTRPPSTPSSGASPSMSMPCPR